MTEPQVEDKHPLSLLESFKLYVWTMWKAGWHTDTEVARMMGVLDRLTDKETINYCFGQLRELVEAHPDAYKDEFKESMVSGEPVLEASGEASSGVVGGSETDKG
jgi:hypothetical protein